MKEDFSDSTFFQKLSSENEEIKKIKWLESEKVKYDIGIDRAILIWVRHYKSRWRYKK